jgi:hypothetical protein
VGEGDADQGDGAGKEADEVVGGHRGGGDLV